MGRYVGEGVLDAGFTGFDWIQENQSRVVEVCELAYSKATSNPARWVLAVPNESKVTRPEDLAGGIVATELVNVTRQYFSQKNIQIQVEFSWGATEVKARLVDAIVELTETGSSLRANELRIIDTVIVSTTRMIANPAAWEDPFKREKIENIAILLQAAIEARSKVGLKMNVPGRIWTPCCACCRPRRARRSRSWRIRNTWPSRWSSTRKWSGPWFRRIKRAGASGLITYPLNKVIH